jgi:putative hydrolase of the HAD superfamily
LQSAEVVYIGDNPNKDFVTAKKLGWLTVHINRTNGIYSFSNVSPEFQAHYKIQDLHELTKIPQLKHLFNYQTV